MAEPDLWAAIGGVRAIGSALIRRLPGVAQAEQVLGQVERLVTQTLAERVADGMTEVQHAARSSLARIDDPADHRPPPPGQVLADLLSRGMDQSSREANAEALVRIVDQLVPDEAKILASLAGRPAALTDVEVRSGLGRDVEVVLSAQTNLGQAAGLRSRALAASYVRHLLELGLVEVGPEDETLGVDYELIEAGHDVRSTIAALEEGRRRPHAVRRTLRLSPLGALLWQSYVDETGTPAPSPRPAP